MSCLTNNGPGARRALQPCPAEFVERKPEEHPFPPEGEEHHFLDFAGDELLAARSREPVNDAEIAGDEPLENSVGSVSVSPRNRHSDTCGVDPNRDTCQHGISVHFFPLISGGTHAGEQ